MNEITVTPQTIGSDLTQTVNAKDVHAELGVKRDFSDWVKAQILRADLLENTDYLTYHKKGVGGQFDSIEYHFTIDAAKNVALMSNTARGKEVRKYFIGVEKAHTSGRLHQEIANAEARVRAEMLANQPVDLLEWLDSSSIVYFGKPGASSMEKRYFAILEAEKIGWPVVARKYKVPYDTLQKWIKETTKADMQEIGHLLTRCDPVKGIQYDLDLEKDARDAARKEMEKAQKRLERKQLKLEQAEAVLKLAKDSK